MGLRMRGGDRRGFGLMALENERVEWWRGRMDAIYGRLCAVGNEI